MCSAVVVTLPSRVDGVWLAEGPVSWVWQQSALPVVGMQTVFRRTSIMMGKNVHRAIAPLPKQHGACPALQGGGCSS